MRKSIPKKIGRKKKERLLVGGSERDLFLSLINQRRKSDLTGKPISIETAQSWQFAHILPKGMYPELRLNPDNIIIVDDIDQHERVDQVVSGSKNEIYKLVLLGKAVETISHLFKEAIFSK